MNTIWFVQYNYAVNTISAFNYTLENHTQSMFDINVKTLKAEIPDTYTKNIMPFW